MPAAIWAAKRGSLAAVADGLSLAARDHVARDAGARREPHADDLAGARAPGGLVDELAGGAVHERDRRGRGLEDAGRRSHDGLHHAARSVRLLHGQRERARRARAPAVRPSAFAKALIEATRRSGIISRPALMVRSSSGETSGQTSDSLYGLGVDGRLARDQRPQRGGHPEHVAARRDGAAGEHLRRHEARRADADGAPTPPPPAREPRRSRRGRSRGRCRSGSGASRRGGRSAARARTGAPRMPRARSRAPSSTGRPGLPRFFSTLPRSSPSTSSITMYLPLGSSKWSSTRTTRGWRSWDSSRASMSKRAAWRVSVEPLERDVLGDLASRARGTRRPSPQPRSARAPCSGRPASGQPRSASPRPQPQGYPGV